METSPGLAGPLRPLGLGELLDRAVKLTIRYFVLFGLIVAVFALPEIVLQYFANEQTAKFMTALAGMVRNQSGSMRRAGIGRSR